MVSREHVRQALDRVMGGVAGIVRGTVPGSGAGRGGDRSLPEVADGFRVDVSEDEDEIVVVADLPGVEQGQTTIGLLSPTYLWIRSIRRSGRSGPGGGGTSPRRDRPVGRLHRVVALPHAVTAGGRRASLTDGVLEIRLKKVGPEQERRIPIEQPVSSTRSVVRDPGPG